MYIYIYIYICISTFLCVLNIGLLNIKQYKSFTNKLLRIQL